MDAPTLNLWEEYDSPILSELRNGFAVPDVPPPFFVDDVLADGAMYLSKR